MKIRIKYIIFFTVLFSKVFGATIVWVGSSPNNEWYNGANWLGGHAPGSTDIASFITGSFDCLINADVMVSGISIASTYGGTLILNENVNLYVNTNGIIQYGGYLNFSGSTKVWGPVKTLSHKFIVNDGTFRQYPANDLFSNYACLFSSSGTTENYNYVKTTDILIPVSIESEIDFLVKGKKTETKEYLDGFGRPIQVVAKQAAINDKDLVVIHQYDATGYETSFYLPYVSTECSGTFKDMDLTHTSNAFASQSSFYSSTNPDLLIAKAGTNGVSYSSIVVEPSPRPRILELGAAGKDWLVGSGHSKTTAYSTNISATEVLYWTYDDAGNTATAQNTSGVIQYYPVNTLYITQNTDEDGKISKTYTDVEGKTILTKSYGNSATDELSTYYIYDSFNRLRYVLPPNATNLAVTALNTNGWSIGYNDDFTKKYLYAYLYDARHRVTEKRVPGIDLQMYIYDQLDRIALSQDGVQRNKTPLPEWNFNKYDAFGRKIISGVYHPVAGTTRTTIQTALNSKTYQYETNTGGGYTSNIYPTDATGNDMIGLIYYDDYDFNNDGTPDNTFSNAGLGTDEPVVFPISTGLITKTQVKNLENESWQNTVMFYDKYNRPVQNQSNNHLAGSSLTDIQTMVYDFSGKVLKTKMTHNIGTSASQQITLSKRFEYNSSNMLTDTYVTIAKGTLVNPEILLSRMVYNNLGQLSEKNLGHSPVNGTFLQSVDYRYNIRGWLTSINNSGLSNDGGITNNDANDLFGMELSYQDNLPSLNTPQFNGNISAVKSSGKNPTSDVVAKGYVYAYDYNNRLTKGEGLSNTAGAWSKSSFFDEIISDGVTPGYDANGNIQKLKRKGYDGSILDNLTYTYAESNTSNLLASIADGSTDAGSIGFTPGAPAGGTYLYDKNGNLLTDPDRKISLSYDSRINLISNVDLTSNPAYLNVNYAYYADGTRFKKIVTNTLNEVGGTHYIGPFEYNENNDGTITLNKIITEEGYIGYDATNGFIFHYFLQDHLGNSRTVANWENSNAVDVPNVSYTYDYYPFGLQQVHRSAISDPNKYQYNGKEFQEETQYDDYGTRMYDPILGRWHAPDNVSHIYPQLSSYAYVANNPIYYKDFDGNLFYAQRTENTQDKDLNERVLSFLSKTFGSEHGFSFDNRILIHSGEYQSSDYNKVLLMKAFLDKIVNSRETDLYYQGTASEIKGHGRLINLKNINSAAIIPPSKSGSGAYFMGNYGNATDPLIAFWHEIGHVFGDLKFGLSTEQSYRSAINFENFVRIDVLKENGRDIYTNDHADSPGYSGQLSDFEIHDFLNIKKNQDLTVDAGPLTESYIVQGVYMPEGPEVDGTLVFKAIWKLFLPNSDPEYKKQGQSIKK